MLGPALVLGCCSGVVTRLSVRPCIACAALLVATAPSLAILGTSANPSDQIVAAMFVLFLIGGVRHLDRAMVRNIASRLDMAALARHDHFTGLLNRLRLREAFIEVMAGKGAAPRSRRLQGGERSTRRSRRRRCPEGRRAAAAAALTRLGGVESVVDRPGLDGDRANALIGRLGVGRAFRVEGRVAGRRGEHRPRVGDPGPIWAGGRAARRRRGLLRGQAWETARPRWPGWRRRATNARHPRRLSAPADRAPPGAPDRRRRPSRPPATRRAPQASPVSSTSPPSTGSGDGRPSSP